MVVIVDGVEGLLRAKLGKPTGTLEAHTASTWCPLRQIPMLYPSLIAAQKEGTRLTIDYSVPTQGIYT